MNELDLLKLPTPHKCSQLVTEVHWDILAIGLALTYIIATPSYCYNSLLN